MSDRTYTQIRPVTLNVGLGKAKALWLEHTAPAGITFEDYSGVSNQITLTNRQIVPIGATKVTGVAAGTLYVLY